MHMCATVPATYGNGGVGEAGMIGSGLDITSAPAECGAATWSGNGCGCPRSTLQVEIVPDWDTKPVTCKRSVPIITANGLNGLGGNGSFGKPPGGVCEAGGGLPPNAVSIVIVEVVVSFS